VKRFKGFPFSALVGQEEMRRALVLAVVDPSLGGVLLRGQKGTAKSTAVRALSSILPLREVSADCPYACPLDSPERFCPDCASRRAAGEGPAGRLEAMRVVELPLGASEDRLIGSLDLGRALASGERRFEPGLLAKANGNLLYVDEINLLEDHLVDVLLDSAAMGVNHVEREGVSVTHPARFSLIGSMNPEEGELRPQLLDRFGLSVELRGDDDVEARTEIVSRRLAFEADPEGFSAAYEAEDRALAARVEAARRLLSSVALPDAVVVLSATASIRLGLDGHRADLALLKAARAHAALRGAASVTRDDVIACAPLALGHRLRRRPFDEPGLGAARLREALEPVEAPLPSSPAPNESSESRTAPFVGARGSA